MSEETQDTQTEVNEVTEVTETLDDVISQYKVQAPVAQEPKRSQPQQPRQHYTPPKLDPLDENSVNQFSKYVDENNSALHSQMQDLASKLTQYEQKEAELRIETEINKAVETVNDGVGLNPKLVRVHLELAAQEKPGFKKVWENRNNDPKTYNRALKAIQKEISDTYSVKQDSELTETQAAIQKSQQSMASSSRQKSEDPATEALKNAKSQAEFDHIWNQMLGR